MMQPLFLDVTSSFYCASWSGAVPTIVGGRYGGADLTPAMAKSVFDNLSLAAPITDFTIGIDSDLSDKALPVGAGIPTLARDVKQLMVWALTKRAMAVLWILL